MNKNKSKIEVGKKVKRKILIEEANRRGKESGKIKVPLSKNGFNKPKEHLRYFRERLKRALYGG